MKGKSLSLLGLTSILSGRMIPGISVPFYDHHRVLNYEMGFIHGDIGTVKETLLTMIER